MSTDMPASDIATRKIIRTSGSHQGLTLIGCGFIVFEALFLVLLSNDFWFATDLTRCGIPAVIVVLMATHVLLCCLESDRICLFVRPLFGGRPPVFYRRWLTFEGTGDSPSGISVGVRKVVWSAIDEVELSMLGNLVFKTGKISGAKAHAGQEKQGWLTRFFPPASTRLDTVTKLPFGITSENEQKEFINTLADKQPDVVLNKRLKDKLKQTSVKGTALVMQLGVVFLLAVLIDVGYSTFSYLEILKNFYQCQKTAQAGGSENLNRARGYFNKAEQLLNHPLPISWVSRKLLKEGNIASDAMETRAESLWALGRKDEAVQSMKTAMELKKKSFRLELRQARYLADMGKLDDARAEVEEAIENHKHAFLPELYAILLIKDPVHREEKYLETLKRLDDDVFEEEPTWPPSGRRYIADLYYRDDLHFVFDRLLKPAGSSETKPDIRNK